MPGSFTTGMLQREALGARGLPRCEVALWLKYNTDGLNVPDCQREKNRTGLILHRHDLVIQSYGFICWYSGSWVRLFDRRETQPSTKAGIPFRADRCLSAANLAYALYCSSQFASYPKIQYSRVRPPLTQPNHERAEGHIKSPHRRVWQHT